ncbi:MAG: hypothetical protein JO202_03215, partial [Ktedonobacteraceae bacterium]|nr:hypothetical protein [Ktedonobacteraceae bacterium]
ALGIAVLPKAPPRLVVPAVDLAALIDVAEYRSALAHYWQQGADGALEDVLRRIVYLCNQVVYVPHVERQEMVRLLCGFNSVAGTAFNELGFPEIAEGYHAKAVGLAIEKKQYELEGFARWRRAHERLNRGEYDAALRDLRQAKALQKKLPGPLNGYVTSLLSTVRAFTAQDKTDFAEAMAFADEAEQAIGEQAECNSFPLGFDRVRYILNLSQAFVASPPQSLHLPNETIKLIETEVPLFDETRFGQYRQIFCNIIYARAHLDKKEYAYGANLLIDALALMEELHLMLLLPEVETLYQRLKTTNYTNSISVARLSLALTQVKYPELFS